MHRSQQIYQCFGAATLILGLLLVISMTAGAEAPALAVTRTSVNSGGIPFVEIRTPRPLSKAEMASITRELAAQSGYRSITVRYFVPPAPEEADYMDWSWAGKVKLYPNGEMRVIGDK